MNLASFASTSDDLNMTISGIFESFEEKESSTPMLEIQFENPSGQEVVIPFFGVCRKNAYENLNQDLKRTTFACVVNEKTANDEWRGEFAKIKYLWTDINGKTVVGGIYRPNLEPKKVSRSRIQSVLFQFRYLRRMEIMNSQLNSIIIV